ncbi:MAG: DUF2189 domain-containing protein [Ketobacter sp.]|nr:MAG: DUF2189 domain-containing protein [Ketobacter sp.]
MDEVKSDSKKPDNQLVAQVRQLEWSAPFKWLRMGWNDYLDARQLSLEYGLFFALSGVLLTALVVYFTSKIFIFGLVFLFILLGPLFAFGLYDIPRQLELGEKPTLKHSLQQIRESAANQWVFAVVICVVSLIWLRAATIIHVFYPEGGDPTLEELLTFFAVGISAGAFFSALVFGISAFSLPMMMDRNVDAISASITSLSAVMNNMWVAGMWGLLIAGLIFLGFATAFIGLIVVLPVIGYATWHGYKDTILD